DGWLRTGDLGRIDTQGHLHLFGRKKNMVVTEGGKNVYPEDVEGAFQGIPVKEFCIFAAHALWPREPALRERLVLVARLPDGAALDDALVETLRERNRRLPAYKRVHAALAWDRDFPRTASMKVKRTPLAGEVGADPSRSAALRAL
ncbi:MAG: hypothetical protein ACREID_00755, partial [Planctomycetota bacterium]